MQAGDIVLLRTDWPKKVDVATEKFWKDAPYTARSACDWLVARRVKAVGYDYPPDYTVRTGIFSPGTKVPREEHTTHDVFFPAGITVIEYLTNLDADRRAALPLHGAAAPDRGRRRLSGPGRRLRGVTRRLHRLQ